MNTTELEPNPTFEALERSYNHNHGLVLQPFQVKELYEALMGAAKDIYILRGALEAVNDAIEEGERLDTQEEELDPETEETREGSLEEE